MFHHENEMTLSKKVRLAKDRLNRYAIELRNEDSVITHQAYGTETTVNPSQFAAFEGVIKSMFTHHFVMKFEEQMLPDENEFEQHIRSTLKYYAFLADANGIDLGRVNMDGLTADATFDDYRYFRKKIVDADLYMQLLD